jgi:hypothetical protein
VPEVAGDIVVAAGGDQGRVFAESREVVVGGARAGLAAGHHRRVVRIHREYVADSRTATQPGERGVGEADGVAGGLLRVRFQGGDQRGRTTGADLVFDGVDPGGHRTLEAGRLAAVTGENRDPRRVGARKQLAGDGGAQLAGSSGDENLKRDLLVSIGRTRDALG